MKTENMKLLDLQTGKYLELGKDWGFFGEFILLNLGSAVELNIKEWGSVSYGDKAYGWHGYIGQETKRPHTNPIINEIAETVGAVVYGGRYVLARNTMCEYNIVYKITYADYISPQIPRNFEYDQHIYSNVIKIEPKYFSDKIICKEKDYLETIKRLHKIKDDTKIEILQVQRCGGIDIFEEYSKQLRNEPNKFDELNQHFK